MRNILAVLFLLASFSVFGAQLPPLPLSQCVQWAPYGFPITKKQRTSKICRSGYVLEHDNTAKIPIWVSYVLTPAHATGCFKRSNKYAADKSLKTPSTQKDYSKSGYDIGHLANGADMSWSKQTEEDSFILSNMAPQLPGFNRGVWKKLEDHVRGWSISRKHALLIYSGPVYNRKQDKMIGKGMVTVPRSFYKIVIDTGTNEVMAFLFPHEPSSDDLETFMTSLAEIQKQTNITFPMPMGAKVADEPWPVALKTSVASKRDACSF